MQSVHLAVGEALYREGDVSEGVYFIVSGEVEVRRSVGADDVTLATLAKGDILGEMGVIRNCPRSTTIVAATDVTLARVDDAAFLQAFGGKDGLGLKLLRMICNRLSVANASVGAPPEKDQAIRSEIGDIRLLGASPEMSKLLGTAGVVITSLPFEVGRTPGGKTHASERRLDLPINSPAAQLDLRHFRIELGGDGRLQARDLESRLGCIVNGRRLSNFEKFEQVPVAPLLVGDNSIVAGGVYSPVQFTLRLRRTLTSAA